MPLPSQALPGSLLSSKVCVNGGNGHQNPVYHLLFRPSIDDGASPEQRNSRIHDLLPCVAVSPLRPQLAASGGPGWAASNSSAIDLSARAIA